MKFEAYNYQCSPLELSGNGFFTEEDKQYRLEALKAMERHLEIVDAFMTSERKEYPQGSEMFLPFKEGNLIRLLRLNARKRKTESRQTDAEVNKPFLRAKLVYAKEGLYIMSLQNVTILPGEMEWHKVEHINQPSCIVILSNREGEQLLMIEANGAFSSTKTVCKIFQDTLRCMLVPEKLNVTFRPHYSTKDVWAHIEAKHQAKIALKSITFHFDYPNMAQDAKLLAGYFSEFGIEMNAEMEYTIKGQHGQPLNVDPTLGNRSQHLSSIFEYAGKTGNRLKMNYFDESRQTYDASKVGISTLSVKEKLRKKLLELVKDATSKDLQTLLPLFDDNGQLKDDISVWLNALGDDQAVNM